MAPASRSSAPPGTTARPAKRDVVRIQGVDVDRFDVGGLLDRVAGLVRDRRRATVAYVNVHVLNQCVGDVALRDFLNAADVVYADGIGVVFGARLLGEHLPERMTAADFVGDLVRRAASEGWRVAWVGGEPGVVDEAVGELREKVPGFDAVLTAHGYAQGAEEDALVDRIAAAAPDLLVVGMGTPIQERWVARHRDRLPGVVWCIGATADFVSGRVSRGPEWLHQRQEWLARLLVDPRRLWRRYLVGNPRFLVRVLAERRRRRRGIEPAEDRR